MLNATELNNFLTAAKDDLPEIFNAFTVVSDDDMAHFVRDSLKVNDPGVSIIGVLPSFNVQALDEDNMTDLNNLMIFLVKRSDRRAGQADFLSIFDNAGAAVKAFLDWIFEKREQFPCKQFFKDIDLNTIAVDPVRDYHSLNGYIINFEIEK